MKQPLPHEDCITVIYDKAYNNDISCLITAYMKDKDIYYKTFHGSDADFVYELLTTKSVGQAIYDLQHDIDIVHKEKSND